MTGPLLNLAVLGTSFAVIFLAELPDKTALASLVLGTRYRPGYVLAGVAAAFTAHVVLAIVAGSLLGLLPHRIVTVMVAVLFAAGAVIMFSRRHDPATDETDRTSPAMANAGPPDDTGSADGASAPDAAASERAQPSGSGTGRPAGPAAARDGFWRVSATSFGLLFVAEFGDLTQVAIANLAARYSQPVSVGIGALAAMCLVAALAIVGGRQLLRIVPFTWITRAAAAVMAALAVLSVLSAISG